MITDNDTLVHVLPSLPETEYITPKIILTEEERQKWHRLMGTLVTNRTKIKKLKPAITIAGATFARFGDFSITLGQRKAGKTTVLQSTIAAALMDEETQAKTDTMQIRCVPANDKYVVYLDTEGSMEDTNDFREGVRQILDVDELPTNFLTFHWREKTQEECREAFELMAKFLPDLHLCVLDGAADILSKLNDEGESNKTVRLIMRVASETNACIVCVLHDNPVKAGQESKGRGHFGSEMERKASGAIYVEKDKEKRLHFIRCRFLRKSEDFEPIAYQFIGDRPTSRILTLEEQRNLLSKDYDKVTELTRLRDHCFLGSDCKSQSEFKTSLALKLPPSQTNGDAKKKQDAMRNKINRTIENLLTNHLVRVEETSKGPIYYPIWDRISEQIG